jgi:hypothetical protein
VLAVRANHTLTAGQADPPPCLAPDPHGHGSKGLRHYDWAMLEVTSDDTPDGHGDGRNVLLVRRHCYTGTLSFYRCWTPGPVPLARLIAVAQARGTVIPPLRRDHAHRQRWSQWRRRHQYRASQAHRRWNAYADAPP